MQRLGFCLKEKDKHIRTLHGSRARLLLPSHLLAPRDVSANTSSLDPLIQERVFQHLLNYVKSGHTVFFSSHTLSEVERLCDCVAVIRRGRLVANETLASLGQRATRHIVIQWSPEADIQQVLPPDCLRIECQQERMWRGTLSGSITPFLRWSAQQSIDDLSISPPDLRNVFQKFYNDRES